MSKEQKRKMGFLNKKRQKNIGLENGDEFKKNTIVI